MMNGLDENTHLLESLKLLIREVMRWKKVWELKKGEKNIQTIQNKIVSNDEGSQFTSLTEAILKTIHLPAWFRKDYI